ncbi:MAG: hypothetical protein ABIO70_23465 [Pseudomonadota bacterium]
MRWVYLVVVLGLMVLCGTAYGAEEDAQADPPRIEREAEWVVPPRVVRCPTSPASLERIRTAIVAWQSQGARFDALVEGQCVGMPPAGEIWVAGPVWLMPPGAVGLTAAKVTEEGCMVSALITLREAAAQPGLYVLEHEIGHAVGFLGHWSTGHLMAPSVPLMGPSWAGIREALAD